jgi:integrase
VSVYLPWIKDPVTGRRRQSKVYWYDFTYLGQRIRESAKTTRRSVAENAEYERKKSLEIAATDGGKIQVIRQKRLRRVSKALEDYQKAYAVTHRPKSIETTRERAAHLLRHLGEVIAADLTPEKILGYIATRKAEKVSNRTINMEISVLSRAMEMRFEDVRRLEENRDVGRALEEEEEERLLDAAARSQSKVLYTVVKIALATGMRHDEIRLLKMTQFDFEKKHVVVGKAKTKGGDGRVIPFGPDLEAVLKTYLNRYAEYFGAAHQPDWYLFPFSNRRRLVDPTRPIATFMRAWDSARTAANVQCRFHDLRHTFCTKLAEDPTIGEETMKSIMGHMSRAMLERYSHIRMHAKRAAILAVEARSREQRRQSLESHVKQSPQQGDSGSTRTLQ